MSCSGNNVVRLMTCPSGRIFLQRAVVVPMDEEEEEDEPPRRQLLSEEVVDED